MKRHLAVSALLGWLSLAAATNAPKLSLEQQAVRADVIVRATVDAPATVQESGQTWTVYPLTILETVAGDAQSLPQYQNRPSVWVLGGVQDAPSLPGGDTMLLLYKERYDSPLVGFNQGKYTLQGGGGAAAKVVTGLPDGTPGVASSVPPASATSPGTLPVAPAVPGGSAPNTAVPGDAPVTVDPAAPSAAPVAPTAPALAPVSGTQANLAQADSVQASAAVPVVVPTPAATAPASDPAPSTPAATPPVVPTVSEASATASASKSAPATSAPSAPAVPLVPELKTTDKTTDSTPVPVTNTPMPNTPVPNNPPAAPPPPANVAAPLQPGQMTLEAFRKLVLEARAKAGK